MFLYLKTYSNSHFLYMTIVLKCILKVLATDQKVLSCYWLELFKFLRHLTCDQNHVNNKDQTCDRKYMEEISDMKENCSQLDCGMTLMQYTVAGSQASISNSVMSSVDIAAQGRNNFITSAPHHCTVQTSQRSQCRASQHNTRLEGLSPGQGALSGCARERNATRESGPHHAHMKTLACFIFVLCCPSLSILVICAFTSFEKINPLKQFLY